MLPQLQEVHPRNGRTRLAPTPSGLLHAGNAIDMLITRRLAQEMGLSLLLRIDDLDAPRVRPEYVADIFISLRWLGIVPDLGPTDPEDLHRHWSQRLRSDRYRATLDRLRNAGVLYGCTCTRSDLQGAGPIYPGHCRGKGIPLDDPAAAWRIEVPKGHQVRSRTMKGNVWRDVHALIGDVVVRQRSIGGAPPVPAYQVASLTDDLDLGITHIVRGEDLLPSTAVQLYMAEVLHEQRFLDVIFVHHPLVKDAQGRKLSKSAGAYSLKAMREAGMDTEALEREADLLYQRLVRG